ncbi:hypothetical protein BOTCAL_0093g00120 [Botryotinia calthae]|uniref:Uncharacterized protein n=1 Tax=Botryotinia calthae TaxID=38488 RepID=A0A4Y8D6T7_9HELO|nr:hypothetical protein BOTCAL_0093g00120 [Botryotinia calthae]
MDPVSMRGLAGSVLTTGKVVTNIIASLITFKSKYESASLMASLLIGQLTTIKTALNEVSNWIATSLHGVGKHEQLIVNLESSVEGCHVFILMLDDRITQLDRNGIDRKLKGKVKLLWNESEIKGLNNQLNTQKPESQKIFKKVEDDRSSLTALRSRSRTSAGTSDSPIAFDFDEEIATTNLYQNVAIHPQMTSNGSEHASRARSKKNMGTKMGLNQNSKQRGTKLTSKRTIEWCLEQAIPSDCDTILPNSRSSSIYEKFSTMNVSDDESRFKPLPWQPVNQRSSPDTLDNPFTDPHEGPTNLPSAHTLYENSSDTSRSHRNNDPCPSSYQHLEILHYILLSGYSNSGKRTLTDSIKFLSQNMTRDESWIYGKAIQSYILRCIMHTVWEMKKINVSSHWAERYGLYNIGDFRDGPLVSHNIWSYKGWPYDHTPETIDQLTTTSWNDQGFRKTFHAWSSKSSRMKAVESYFRSIDRIWGSSYIPTKEYLLLLFNRAINMDIMWGNRIVKIYNYGGFKNHHQKWEHVRMAIGPKTILYTISMLSSEFLKDVDTYQPFLDLVHFQAACETRNWTIPTCVILFTHLDELMTSSESLTTIREAFKQYFPRFWSKYGDTEHIKSAVEHKVMEVARKQNRVVVVVLFENSLDSKGETTETVMDILFKNSPNGKWNNELILAPYCL